MGWQILLLRMGAAAVAGMIIGAEREWHEKTAGFRTVTLVSIGSAAFMLAAVSAAPSQGVRMMAGIATGVGFLGAGAIIHERREVVGLTTAASVWMAAAVGSTAALGLFTLTIIETLAALLVLTLLTYVPFGRIQEDERVYTLAFAASPADAHAHAPGRDVFEQVGLAAVLLSVSTQGGGTVVEWQAEGTKTSHDKALALLSANPDLAWFKFGD